MNDLEYEIIGLRGKIERNKKDSNKCKLLAALGPFCALCFCVGQYALNEKKLMEAIVITIIWLISMAAVILIYHKDVSYVKNSKMTEFAIYELDVKAREIKLEAARIAKMALPDYVASRQIKMPDEEITLPTLYYIILGGIDIFIGIFWLAFLIR